MLWAVIQPLFTMLLFAVISGTFAKLPSAGIPYPIFYYVALSLCCPGPTSRTVTQAGSASLSNAGLITKVYFPRVALPIAHALSGLVDFAIGSLLLLALLLYYRLSSTVLSQK